MSWKLLRGQSPSEAMEGGAKRPRLDVDVDAVLRRIGALLLADQPVRTLAGVDELVDDALVARGANVVRYLSFPAT
eukprot:14499598-Alexandrium_andersonii.AAC.1